MATSNDIPEFGVLSDLKILSTGSVIAQPYAASVMAEAGADVICVESTVAPDVCRKIKYAFNQEHRNKRSLTLNIPSPEGKEVFLKLIQWADIWSDVPCSVINSLEMMINDPHVQARKIFIEWEDPQYGNVKGVNCLPHFKYNPSQIWRGAPLYGMDNSDILSDLGYSEEQIQDLYERGVTKSEEGAVGCR